MECMLMLFTIFAGISAVLTGILGFTKFLDQPVYNLIWLVPLMLIGFFVAAMLLYVLIMYILTEIFCDMDEPVDEPKKFWLAQYDALAVAMCMFFNIRVHVTGLEKVPKDERFLLVCNHRSLFDPIVKVHVFKDYGLRYVSKQSNFKIFVGGKMMHLTGSLALDRENNREALKTINKMTELIRDDVASVAIYPEGTRNKKDGLLPFHAGSFKPAQKAGAPVVVVALRGTDLAAKGGPFRKADVYIDVVKVISGEFAKNNPTAVTAQTAKDAIDKKLKEYAKNKETVSA